MWGIMLQWDEGGLACVGWQRHPPQRLGVGLVRTEFHSLQAASTCAQRLRENSTIDLTATPRRIDAD